MSTAPNPRASLLAGLRTGGVRSASQPAVPQTAAPTGSFNIPRLSSFAGQHIPEDEADELADMVSHDLRLNGTRRLSQPVTASAADGVGNRFQQQQQQALFRQLAAQRAAASGVPFGAMNGMGVDQQVQLQMQVMQMEMLKLQALQQAQQVQQYQAELLAQAQAQRQQEQMQNLTGRRGAQFREPAPAGPTNMAFDLRNAAASAQLRNGPAEDFRVNGHDESQVPMTAALGGKFGSRTSQSGLNPNANVFTSRVEHFPETPLPKTASPPTGNSRTTVISGGTPLGTPVGTPMASTMTPSKSDSALSWRRGGPPAATNGRSVSNAVSPSVRVTPPSGDDMPLPQITKGRPEPLRFSNVTSGGLASVSVDHAEYDDSTDSDRSYGSDLAQIATITGDTESSDTSPGTPPSAGSGISLSAREEATKRLYEGLGIGRPTQNVPPVTVTPPIRIFSQPIRQPRGPPASVDELGARNFASRLPMKLLIGEY